MNKQELIKQAYGKSWELCRPFIDENGFCVVFKDSDHEFIGVAGNETHFKEHEIEGGQLNHSIFGKGISFRPKTLNGIEHNNGWTKIESENDLPVDHGCIYKVWLHKNDRPARSYYSLTDLIADYKHGIILHYKAIKEDRPPLY